MDENIDYCAIGFVILMSLHVNLFLVKWEGITHFTLDLSSSWAYPGVDMEGH